MIDQTTINMLALLQQHGVKLKKVAATGGGEYHGACPKCGGTDRFHVQPEAGNGGRWACRQCSPQWGDGIGFLQFMGKSFEEACTELGIAINGNGNSNAPVDLARTPESAPTTPPLKIAQAKPEKPTKRHYTGLEDYAKQHGVTANPFNLKGWREGEYNGRPCLFIPGHDDGIERVRFLDGKGEFMPVKSGRKRCLYGWSDAIQTADKLDTPLVLCNGQPSVAIAQYFGIAAIAQTDGEAALEDHTLEQLAGELRKGRKLIIALDADAQGRKVTQLIKTQLDAFQVAVVDFGGNSGYDLGDFAARHQQDTMTQLSRLMRISHQDPRQIVTLAEMGDDFNSLMIDGDDYHPDGDMILFPFQRFHELGGFAHIVTPGKMTAVVAYSGGGKTTFMETMRDKWLQDGYDCLWYSPEWSERENYWRMIQRYGGATFDQISQHALWVSCKRQKIKPNPGKQLLATSSEYVKSMQARREIDNWPGHLHFFREARFTEQLLDRATDHLHLLRREERRVPVVFFDYAQLMKTQETQESRTAYETMIGMIKSWTMEQAIHAVVGVQVPMALGRIKNHILGKYDMHYVPPNAFNLIVTLNILPDMNDPDQRSEAAIVNVAKNSTGREGRVKMTTNFEHLSWLDKDWSDRVITFNTKGNDHD